MREITSLRTCRFCGERLKYSFVDLGMSPLCESYVPVEKLDSMEPFYPLHVLVCHRCFLVQLGEYVAPEEIFSEYAYFSSYSDTWLDHARRYTLEMKDRLDLGPDSLVVEVASNDGCLLQYFVEQQIPVLGIEPAGKVARVAEQKGVPTLVRFFGRELTTIAGYTEFARHVEEAKWRLLEFLIEARRNGRRLVGYGAPGKGNTLLNYCRIRTDFIKFVVDRNPYKQGKFLPGTHIPIAHPDRIPEVKPDYVLILPWNLRDEIVRQLAFIRQWGRRFVVPIPSVQVID